MTTRNPCLSLNPVRTFYDHVLEVGRKTPSGSPLFADGIDVQRRQPAVAANGRIICNFAQQQNLIRGLVGLSLVTRQEMYREAAREATAYVLKHLVNPISGLIYWGGHVYWDLVRNAACDEYHKLHELKYDFPYYDFMYEVDPRVTRRFIEGFWRSHVDLESEWRLFGRHAVIDRAGPGRKVSPGELAFLSTGAELFYAAGFLYSKTGEALWLNRALDMAGRFAKLRDPHTKLGLNVLDCQDPTFDLSITQLSLGHLGITMHNLYSANARRVDSYALCQLYLAQQLKGEASRSFVNWALEDFQAYAKYCYDPGENAFYEMRRTDSGQRIRFEESRWIPSNDYGHYYPREKFEKNIALPPVFYAFARAYRLSHDPTLLDTARRCLSILGIEPGQSVSLAGIAAEYFKSDFAGCLIQGLLELHEATKEAIYQNAAVELADDALRTFFDGNFFRDWPDPDMRLSRVNQNLPLALLRLAASFRPEPVELPADIGGYGMESCRPNRISSLDIEASIRCMWSKHFVDLRSGPLTARIGDEFPHDGGADANAFGYPGVWRLCSPESPDNVLDETRGIVFEPLRRDDMIAVRKIRVDEAKIEHWEYKKAGEPAEPPYFTIRMQYLLKPPCSLDWYLEVTPLETNAGHLALKGMAYLNKAAAREFTFWNLLPGGKPCLKGVSAQEFSAWRNVLPGVEEIWPLPRGQSALLSPEIYSLPAFCTPVGKVIMVMMFPPEAKIEFHAQGPTSEDGSGAARGFIWHIEDAQAGVPHTLNVRIGLFPAGTSLTAIRKEHERFCIELQAGAVAGAKDRQLYEKGREQFRGLIKLETWYLHRLLQEERIDFDEAINKRVGFRAMISFERPGVPSWTTVTGAIKALFGQYGGDVSGLENAMGEYLWPYVEGSLAREIRALREPMKWHNGFNHEYLPHYAKPGSPDHVTLHFRNLFIPDSPFKHMSELAEGLRQVLAIAKQERPDVTLVQCASWLNSHPKFQPLFPEEWTRTSEPGTPGNHMGWWGQFVERDWGFNRKAGEMFRAKGVFPFEHRMCACELKRLWDHLQRMR